MLSRGPNFRRGLIKKGSCVKRINREGVKKWEVKDFFIISII